MIMIVSKIEIKIKKLKGQSLFINSAVLHLTPDIRNS